MKDKSKMAKFANRIARFDRNTQQVVVEFKDGSSMVVEKKDGEYIFCGENKCITGFDNIMQTVEKMIGENLVSDVYIDWL